MASAVCTHHVHSTHPDTGGSSSRGDGGGGDDDGGGDDPSVPSGHVCPELDAKLVRLAIPGEVVAIKPGLLPLVEEAARQNPWVQATIKDDQGRHKLVPQTAAALLEDCRREAIVS